MKLHHHLARWLLAAMLVVVLQPMLAAPRAHAATLIPETPISPMADKSYDRFGHYYAGYLPDRKEHLVGYGRDNSENYGDSFYAIKYKIDSSTMQTSKVVAKAELFMFVNSLNDDVDIPDDKIIFKLYTSTDIGWDDTDSHPIDQSKLTLVGTYGSSVFYTGASVRLDVTTKFNEYRAANPTATEITFFLKGPLEADLPASETQNPVTTDAFALIADSTADTAARRPHLDLFYSANTAPKGITLSNSAVAENSPAGTPVGTLSATDDEGGAMTYTLAAGGVDNGSFQIADNQLLTAASFNYEAKSSYSIKVQVADSEGLTFVKDFTISVTNVNEAPSGTITINSGQTYTNNLSASLALTGSDPENGPLTMSFSLDGSTYGTPVAYSPSASINLAAGDGLKTVFYKVIDSGGLSSPVVSDSIILDQTAPAGTLKINNGDAVTSSNNVTLNMTATDASGSAIQMQFSNDGTAWSPWEPFSTSKAWTMASGGGTKTVYLHLSDQAGNVSTVTDTIDVDTTPPDGSLTIEGGAAAVNHGTVQLQLTNPDASAVSMQFQNESGAWSSWETYAAAKSWTLSTGDGVKTVNAHLKDAAGNIATFNDTIELDTVPPVISGIANGAVTNSDVTLTFDGTGTLDSAAFTSGSKVTSEGDHTLVAADAAGNTATITFTIDKTAPNGMVAINSGAAATNSTAVNLAISNPDGTAKQMQFSNDGTAWSGWETYSATKSWTISSGDGSKTVHVQLKDQAGNVSDASDTISLDTTPPAVTGVANGTVYNTDVTITFTEGTATLDSNPFNSGDKVTAEGVHSLVVTDAAGNTTTITFTIDTTAPNGTIKINSGDAATNNTTVHLALTNPDGSAVQMQFSNDGTTWSGWEPYAATKTGWAIASGDGTKTVYVELKDAAGNVSRTDDGIELDTVGPDGSLTVEGGAGYVSQSSVNLQIANPDGSAVEMRFSNDGSSWSSWGAYAAAKSGWALATGDGPKTVRVELKDALGNVSGYSDTITLDTTPPVVGGVTNSGLYNTDVTITFNEGTGVLDGGPFNSGSKATAEGAHTLVVTDNAGNTSTVAFTIDKTAPNGTITINSGDTATNNTTVGLTLTNSDSSAVQMQFSNDGTTWSGWEPYSASKTGWTLTTGDGVKTVYVELKDAAGNTAQTSDSIELDTAGPNGSLTIKGGADYTNQTAVGLQIANPDGSAVEMRFSNGSSWSSWEPFAATKSGWALAAGEGLKTVQVELKDALGNVSGYSDTITLDTIAPVVNGVTNGGLYNANVTITFNEGTADLDGNSFNSGNEAAAEGAHTLTVTDEAGNATTVAFTIDKTAPNGSITIKGGAAATNATTVVLTLTNPDGTAKQMQFSNDGTAWSGWEPYAATKPGWTLTTGDGAKTVHAQFKDQAGNVFDLSDTITLDTIAPVIGGVTNGGLYNTDLTITFNEGTGQLDGNPFNTGDQVSAEGAHALAVTDAAGNTATITFTIDKTAPNGTVTINGGDAATNNTTVALTLTNPDGTAKQMQFSNDGTTWSGWETYAATKSGWTLTTGDGGKTVYAQFKDQVGNVFNLSDAITFDTTPPVVDGVTNGGLINADATITFNEGTGVLDGNPFNTGDKASAEGNHTLIVTDEAGNTTTVTFTIDKTAPAGTVVINGGDAATNAASVDLTLTNSDGTAVQMQFSNDGTTWSGWEPYAATKTGWTLTTGDGVKTVQAELKDAAGNVLRVNDTIELDMTGPSGALTIKGGDAYTNQSAVDLQIANPDGTAVEMRFSNDGSAWSSWETYAAAKSGWALLSGDGVKTVNVELRDSLGNPAGYNDTVALDTVAPVVDGVSNGGLYNTDLTITFNEGTGVLDGNPFNTGGTVASEGNHTLTVTDPAGNATAVTFKLDKTAPAGTLVINGGASLTNTLSASLTLTSDGSAEQMRFSNDGTTWGSWESFAANKAWTLAAGDGAKTVRVQLKDQAGNIGSASGIIRVDMTAPTGSALINAGAPYTTDDDVVVTVTANDAGASASGVAQISYSVDGGATWSVWSRYIPALTVKLPSGFGTRSVTVKVKDAAGNESAPFTDSITVRSVPVVNNHTSNGTEDVPYQPQAADYSVTNDDGTALSTIEIVALPQHGTLKLRETAVKAGDKVSAVDALSFLFIPEANWNGVTSLTWRGEADSIASAADAVLTLNIAAVNDAPVAQNASFGTTQNRNAEGKLTSSDVDGDTLTYSIVDQPAAGKIQLDAATGTFTFTPGKQDADTFTYRSFDGTAYSNTATATVTNVVTWTPPAVAPVAPETPNNPDGNDEQYATIDGDKDSALNDNLHTTVNETELGTTVIVTIKGDQWTGELPGNPEEPVKIVVSPGVDAGVVLIDTSMTNKLTEAGRGVTVELGGHSVTLPDEIMAQLAVYMKSKTAVLRIEIAETSEANEAAADKAAKKSGARIVATPMQYQVYIEDGGKRTDLSSFNGYLDIHYKTEELQGANPTTAALVGANGKLRPLPTQFDKSSNSTDIRVHGLTHGTFVLIETDVSFNDTNGHWAEESIDALADRLVINGVGGGRFEPNRTATRAEFSSILVQAFGMYGLNQALTYPDTPSGSWYEEALQFASGYGIITGYSDGSFRPNATITREEAMVIMARTADLLGLGADLTEEQITNALSQFGDDEALHGWSREAAALCVSLGIVNGIGDSLQPGQSITRAQLATMVENLLKKAAYI